MSDSLWWDAAKGYGPVGRERYRALVPRRWPCGVSKLGFACKWWAMGACRGAHPYRERRSPRNRRGYIRRGPARLAFGPIPVVWSARIRFSRQEAVFADHAAESISALDMV